MSRIDIARTPAKVGTRKMATRIVTTSLPLQGVEPAAVLMSGMEGARGFWAREGRWIAHVGEVSTIHVDGNDGVEDRFRQVWKAARAISGGICHSGRDGLEPGGGDSGPPQRFFGGFSFRGDHQSQGPWQAFPTARFVLPSLELVGGREGGVLHLRKALRPGDHAGAVAEGLTEEIRTLAGRLKKASSFRDRTGENEEHSRGPGRDPDLAGGTDRGPWEAAVDRALREISHGAFSKVVLARALTASFPEARDPVDVVMNLWQENPGAYVFLFEPAPGASLIGAAPETLATVSQGAFQATAVAGSSGAGRDEGERRRLARRLMESEKDLREHRVCVQDMMARLGEVAEETRADAEPHVLSLSSIQHLETFIGATMNEGSTVLSALRVLHPTPAVCGFPRDDALAFLREVEPFHRGWYAGPVGWFDLDGDGVFVPALRSAVGTGREWVLFAGAGVVAGSDPGEEWEETRIKFDPVLNALSKKGGRKSPQAEPG